MKILKAAIIGTGYGERVMRPCINFSKNIDLKYIYSRNIKSKFKKKYKKIITNSLNKIKEDKEIRVIFLETPPFTHLKYLNFFSKTNKHIICEKPLAHNKNEVKKIINLYKNKKTICGINHQLRFDPYIQEIKKLLKKKIIGKEISISITHNTNKFKEKKKDSWWMKNNLGGGELNAIGSHLIDLVQFIFGDISQFNGAIKNYKNKNLSIDLGFILNLKFLKNKIGLLQSSCNSKNNKGLSITIVGEKGEIILNNFNNLIIKKNLNKKKNNYKR